MKKKTEIQIALEYLSLFNIEFIKDENNHFSIKDWQEGKISHEIIHPYYNKDGSTVNLNDIKRYASRLNFRRTLDCDIELSKVVMKPDFRSDIIILQCDNITFSMPHAYNFTPVETVEFVSAGFAFGRKVLPLLDGKSVQLRYDAYNVISGIWTCQIDAIKTSKIGFLTLEDYCSLIIEYTSDNKTTLVERSYPQPEKRSSYDVLIPLNKLSSMVAFL